MVRTFRHAIALDERRANFKANMWNRPTRNEELLSITDQEAAVKVQKAEQRKAKGSNNHKGHMHRYETQYSNIRHETNVEEVGDLILPVTMLLIRYPVAGVVRWLPLWYVYYLSMLIHYLTVALLEDVGGGSGEGHLHVISFYLQLTFVLSFQCH